LYCVILNYHEDISGVIILGGSLSAVAQVSSYLFSLYDTDSHCTELPRVDQSWIARCNWISCTIEARLTDVVARARGVMCI
jgi:DNA-binding transcriptional regulator YbjK